MIIQVVLVVVLVAVAVSAAVVVTVALVVRGGIYLRIKLTQSLEVGRDKSLILLTDTDFQCYIRISRKTPSRVLTSIRHHRIIVVVCPSFEVDARSQH